MSAQSLVFAEFDSLFSGLKAINDLPSGLSSEILNTTVCEWGSVRVLILSDDQLLSQLIDWVSKTRPEDSKIYQNGFQLSEHLHYLNKPLKDPKLTVVYETDKTSELLDFMSEVLANNGSVQDFVLRRVGSPGGFCIAGFTQPNKFTEKYQSISF